MFVLIFGIHKFSLFVHSFHYLYIFVHSTSAVGHR